MKFYEDAVYIQMCERAVELQKQRIDEKGGFRLYHGDYVCYPDDTGTKHVCIISNKDIYYLGEQFGFIILRQDQLQEMYGTSVNVFFNQFTEKLNEGWFAHANTAEGYMIQMVVDKLFNKTWNGEEWV